MLPTKDEEVTRTEASFLRGTKLERGRHSVSSLDSHFASLSISKCMWAALRLHLDLASILHALK
jgi:hypothetical protein